MGQTVSSCLSGLTLPFLPTYNIPDASNYFASVIENTPSNFGTLEYWVTNRTNSDELIVILNTATNDNARIRIDSGFLRMMVYNTKTNRISPVPINDGFVFDHITQTYENSNDFKESKYYANWNAAGDYILRIESTVDLNIWHGSSPSTLVISGIMTKCCRNRPLHEYSKRLGQFMAILNLNYAIKHGEFEKVRFFTFPPEIDANLEWITPFEWSAIIETTTFQNWIFGTNGTKVCIWNMLDSNVHDNWNLKLEPDILLDNRVQRRFRIISLCHGDSLHKNKVQLLVFGNSNYDSVGRNSFWTSFSVIEVTFTSQNQKQIENMENTQSTTNEKNRKNKRYISISKKKHEKSRHNWKFVPLAIISNLIFSKK